jgi:hypothetical protein
MKIRKTMENHQKQRKMKKKWSCKWKKMKIWTQSCRFSLRTRKSSKTRGELHFFNHFFVIFFHFPCPWHLKSRKTMKNHKFSSIFVMSWLIRQSRMSYLKARDLHLFSLRRINNQLDISRCSNTMA